MKRKYKILIGIVLVLIPIYIIGIKYQPKSIHYKITRDYYESDTQKNFEANVIFADNQLVTADEKIQEYGPFGCKNGECNKKYECGNGVTYGWKGYANGYSATCEIENYVPLSLKQIEKKIEVGEFKPKSNCVQNDFCYEIIN